MWITLTHEQGGPRDGSEGNPYEPGDVLFTLTPHDFSGAVGTSYSWRKLVGGVTEHPDTPFPEYGREGFSPKLGIPPLTTLSKFEYTATARDDDGIITKSVTFWVMAGKPEAFWDIHCTDGVVVVDADERKWLQDNNHLYDGMPDIKFAGTVAELRAMLQSWKVEEDPPDPEPTPDPTKHPIICSDGTIYATTHEFTWLLDHGKIGNAGGKTYFNGDAAQLAAIITVIPPKPQPDPDPDPEPEEPGEYRYFLPLRVVDDIDTGVFLSAGKTAHVKIHLFKQQVPSSVTGELQDSKSITLGAFNPLTEMVRGNWHIQEADLAVVTSDVPIVCCAVWVTKDGEYQYTGFPGLEE